MDHIDTDDRIRSLDRPRLRPGSIERQRREKIGQAGMLAPSRDAGQRSRIGIGRLPLQMRQRGGVMDGMLAGSRRDFGQRV